MKLARPKLSVSLADSTIAAMVDDGELETASLRAQLAPNCNVAALQLLDVLIEDVQFTGAHFSRIVARDVIASRTDFSASHLDNGLLVRVEFRQCRMTGVDFSQTDIHDVTFTECKLDKAMFYKADLRRVAFIGCDLSAVDFSAAHLVDVQQ
jgi:uncharacterized protein YjbI with pentapeptide repeats